MSTKRKGNNFTKTEWMEWKMRGNHEELTIVDEEISLNKFYIFSRGKLVFFASVFIVWYLYLFLFFSRLWNVNFPHAMGFSLFRILVDVAVA